MVIPNFLSDLLPGTESDRRKIPPSATFELKAIKYDGQVLYTQTLSPGGTFYSLLHPSLVKK